MHLENNPSILANLKNDLPASVIVFLVAVPLCLGIALASGAPLFSGIIAGIIGGIVVGVLSGSKLGVSGPAAGLAVIVLTAITELGAFETFLLAVVIGGIIQLILGFLQAGIIAFYFPSSVIKGMLSGIGIIIILKQIPHAFGYDNDYEGSVSFSQPDGHNTLSELFYMFEAITPGAILITIISMVILILWEQNFIKKIKLFKFIQGPLVVVTIGIILNIILSSTSMALSPQHIVAIPVASGFTDFISQFTFPDFSQLSNPKVYTVGFTIAVVASIETLLCLEATDKLDPDKNITPTNRELKAQGVGNIISGLIGGLPITQVIVRSSTNIQSGGKTKMSAISHGFILLLSAALIPTLLNKIPLASLAAILFIVGYKLAKPSLFKSMYAKGWTSFLPFIVTIISIIFTDLLTGIGIGMVIAIFIILFNNYRKPFIFEREEHMTDGVIRIELAEDVTFLNKANILRALAEIPDHSTVIVDASKSINIDLDIIEIIEDFEKQADIRHIDFQFIDRKRKGIQKSPSKKLINEMSNQQAKADTIN